MNLDMNVTRIVVVFALIICIPENVFFARFNLYLFPSDRIFYYFLIKDDNMYTIIMG